jgi:ribosome biogenesis GTPase
VRAKGTKVNLMESGWNASLQADFERLSRAELVPARVSSVMKGHFSVWSETGERLAKLSGKLLFQVKSSRDLPAVGDWVAIGTRPGDRRAIVHHVLPRRTVLLRKIAGRAAEEQVIAANVDTVFVVSGMNHEFNPRRLERYVALVWDSGAQPVILLNKADLSNNVRACLAEAELSAPGVAVHAISAAEGAGFRELEGYFGPGRTCAFIGSSGVGKSTIINRLLGENVQATLPVRECDDRGRHSTTSRQMFVLSSGGLVIDTPGMRELQLWAAEGGLIAAFDDIDQFATQCRYRDCMHQSEPGCSVRDAVEEGTLDGARLANFLKLRAEQAYLDRKLDIHAAQEAKARARLLCKEVRKITKLKDRT